MVSDLMVRSSLSMLQLVTSTIVRATLQLYLMLPCLLDTIEVDKIITSISNFEYCTRVFDVAVGRDNTNNILAKP